LHAPNQITPLRYYKNFASISGALAAATLSGPVVSIWLPEPTQSYIFPPLGEETVPARLGLIALAIAVTFIAFFAAQRPSNIFRRLLAIGLVSLLALFFYLVSFHYFVRRVDVPVNNSAILVSIGYERTEFADRSFDSESDWDILRERGTGDEEILKLWTVRSIIIARLCLATSYCGMVLPLVLIFSLGVRWQ
jgi:hypothetical protein